MNISLVLQIIGFLVTNKNQIREMVLAIEALIPDVPGPSKANTVKIFIGEALGVADSIESVWPLVLPLFNLFVSKVKTQN